MRGTFELLVALIVLAATLVAGFALGEYWTGFLARCVSWMFLAISFTIAYSYANVPSVAQATLFGIGAYAGLWAAEPSGGSVLVMMLAACAAGFVAALLMGALILRMTRNGASIATIIIAVIGFLLGNASVPLTGGADGMALPRSDFHLLGLPVTAGSNASMLMLGCVVLALMLVAFWFVSRTHTWRVTRAVQQNAMRAQVLGYSADRYRLVVFCASGAIAGLGGSLYTLVSQHLTTDMMSLFMSLKAIMWAAVGGVVTVFGGPLGVLFVQVFTEVLSRWTYRNDLFLGAVLILVALWLPHGLMGLLSHFETFRRRDKAAAQPGEPAAQEHATATTRQRELL